MTIVARSMMRRSVPPAAVGTDCATTVVAFAIPGGVVLHVQTLCRAMLDVPVMVNASMDIVFVPPPGAAPTAPSC